MSKPDRWIKYVPAIVRTQPSFKPSLQQNPRTARRRLLLLLLMFLLCLSIPVFVLVQKVYSQFRMEMYYQYRESAELLVSHINGEINNILAIEESRPFADYQFYKVSESPLLKQREITLSPLAQLQENQVTPGLIGYFQVDPAGNFSSPVLPRLDEAQLENSSMHIVKDEFEKRLERKNKIEIILRQANIVPIKATAGSESSDTYMADFKEKPLQQINAKEQSLAKLKLNESFSKNSAKKLSSGEALYDAKISSQSRLDAIRSKAKSKPRVSRKENVLTSAREEAGYFLEKATQQNILAEGLAEAELKNKDNEEEGASPLAQRKQEQQFFRNSIPDAELINVIADISPFQVVRTQLGHYLFYRNVWKQQKRYIQGFIVSESLYLNARILPLFQGGNFHSNTQMLLAYNNDIIAKFDFENARYRKLNSISQESDENLLIYRSHLNAPFNAIELLVTNQSIPLGPGSSIINLLILIVLFVASVGAYFFYRIGIKHIKLAEERLNFVSSVSHELKTPLTSILMYGEMLKENMVADEEKRKSYYDFIYFESERLSRLINNVLQLAKLSNNNAESNILDLDSMAAKTIVDLTRSKVSTLLERNKFTLNITEFNAETEKLNLLVDADALSQILINLVDNAIKFSTDNSRREIDLSFGVATDKPQTAFISIRDYGRGIPKEQAKKIFELFYRIGSELTRKTPGTGIGLALVNELSRAMGGRVEFINHSPGAEFRVFLARAPL